MATARVGIGRAESEEHAKERRWNREMVYGCPETHAGQEREIGPQLPGFGETRRGVFIGLSPRQYSLHYAEGVRSGGKDKGKGRKRRVLLVTDRAASYAKVR